MIFREKVYSSIQSNPGLSDRELTKILLGPNSAQQPINQECRNLANSDRIIRVLREDGILGNYPKETVPPSRPNYAPAPARDDHNWLSEDQVKEAVKHWLLDDGWKIETINFGHSRGIDIIATKNGQSWIIEAKGQGSRQPMRVNYFLGVLGEMLQRMNDPLAQYSIALPDIQQFRRLWARLPALAKTRTGITALFVSSNGDLFHIK